MKHKISGLTFGEVHYIHPYIELKGVAPVSPIFKWMWQSCSRGRNKLIFWLLLKDRLNTRNILRRKNRILDNYSCPVCSSNAEETMMHLFFTCSFSQWCWRFLNIRWNASLEIMDMIVDARIQFNSKIFREIIIVACWTTWTHRNEVIFDGVVVSLRRWKQIFGVEFDLMLHKVKPSQKMELKSWLCNLR